MRRVEVAGRLVGEQHGRPAHEGAGDGDALLLAARKLGRLVPEPVGQADRLDEFLEPTRVELAPGDRQRQGDVLRRRQGRQEVERLEDEADLVAAQLREARGP